MKYICQEVGIFKIAQQSQVDTNAKYQPRLAGPAALGPLGHPPCYEEVGADDEQQYEYGKSAGLVIEEKACEEQENVPHVTLASHQGKQGIYYPEKCPEIKLGENQRRRRIVCKQFLQHLSYSHSRIRAVYNKSPRSS